MENGVPSKCFRKFPFILIILPCVWPDGENVLKSDIISVESQTEVYVTSESTCGVTARP